MNKIYYAHHIWKYGTDIEKYEVEIIKSEFLEYNIFNPSTDIPQSIPMSDIIDKCLEQVSKSSMLIFSSVNGCIGKGVYREIEKALEFNVPVFYIFYNTVLPFNMSMCEKINDAKSGEIYANIII